MAKRIQYLEVCLYGAQHCGFRWLAMGPGKLKGGKPLGKQKMFGTGEISKGVSSCTEALWLALQQLEAAGAKRGAPVKVFLPGGERLVRTKVGSCKAVGDLTSEAAPVHVVSAEEVKKASKEG